jgi:hypothetical protein
MYGRTYFAVWDFRLSRADAAGRPLAPIPVQMHGRRFSGGISNGDTVDVGEDYQEGQLVTARQVRNLTTGITVRAIGRRHPFWRGVGFAFVGLFMLFWLLLLVTQVR